MDWKSRPLDASYLLDSGLLFEINRTTLHPLGLALTVSTDPQSGKSRLTFKDARTAPETLVFDKNAYEVGTLKLRQFMEKFGKAQMDVRRSRLGWGYQSCGIAKS